MRTLLQSVTKANITINNTETRSIERGVVIFVGFTQSDTKEVVEKVTEKILNLRYFTDENGKTNISIGEITGEILIVSQFTLYADCRRGRRPSFTDAATPEVAIPLYKYFIKCMRKSNLHIETGEFGADMLVEIHNNGPFTLWLDSGEIDKSE